MSILLAKILIVIYAACASFWFGRMDGGAPPKTPEQFERALVLLPVVISGFLVHWMVGLVALAGYAGIATGHGMYFLGRNVKVIESVEFFDFLVRPFFGRDPRALAKGTPLSIIKTAMDDYGMRKLYWRNVFGLTVVGLIVTLPLGVATIMFGHIIPGIIMLLAGAAKSVAYIIGYHLYESGKTVKWPLYVSVDTEIGEGLNGFDRTLLLGAAVLIMEYLHV